MNRPARYRAHFRVFGFNSRDIFGNVGGVFGRKCDFRVRETSGEAVIDELGASFELRARAMISS